MKQTVVCNANLDPICVLYLLALCLQCKIKKDKHLGQQTCLGRVGEPAVIFI